MQGRSEFNGGELLRLILAIMAREITRAFPQCQDIPLSRPDEAALIAGRVQFSDIGNQQGRLALRDEPQLAHKLLSTGFAG